MRYWDPKFYEQLLGLQDVDMDIRTLQEEIDDLIRKSKAEDPKLVRFKLDLEGIDERIEGARAQHLMYKGTLEDIRSAITGLATTKAGVVKPRTRSSTEALRIEEEKLGTLVDETLRQIKQLERDRERIVEEMENRALEVDSSQQEPEAEIRKLQNRIKKLEVQREKDSEGLPAPLLRRYDRLRGSRSGVGLTTLDNGICGVCRMEMPTSITGRLLKGEWIESCPACGRMVAKVTFHHEAKTQAEQKSSRAPRKKTAATAAKKKKVTKTAKKAAVKKKPAKKKATTDSAAEKKPTTKKTAAKKTPAKKPAAKKAPAKKTADKKTAAKKTPAKKPAAKPAAKTQTTKEKKTADKGAKTKRSPSKKSATSTSAAKSALSKNA